MHTYSPSIPSKNGFLYSPHCNLSNFWFEFWNALPFTLAHTWPFTNCIIINFLISNTSMHTRVLIKSNISHFIWGVYNILVNACGATNIFPSNYLHHTYGYGIVKFYNNLNILKIVLFKITLLKYLSQKCCRWILSAL